MQKRHSGLDQKIMRYFKVAYEHDINWSLNEFYKSKKVEMCVTTLFVGKYVQKRMKI